MDLWIRGGLVCTPAALEPLEVGVRHGRVAALAPPGSAPADAPALDAEGCVVLPGLVDAHVHFREPGLSHKEDWLAGSTAAVAGGVTCVLDMPNVVPPTATAAALEAKAADVAGRSRCHYGFYGLLAAANVDQIDALAVAGAIGLKLFLGETTASLPAPADGALLEALRVAGARGLRTMVHAENGDLLSTAACRAAGIEGLDAHLAARPALAEVEAVTRICLLAAAAGAPVAVAHLSAAGAVRAVRRAKGDGVDVRGEACPHHLLLTHAQAAHLGALAKVNPPLRAEADQAALWAGIADGTIDEIGSDHAPHATSEKACAVPAAPAGFAGVQLILPMLYGRLGPRRLVELCAAGPARSWGLWPAKGRIAVGADADLVVVRPEAPSKPVHQWSRHPDGPVLRLCPPTAEVVATLVDGRPVWLHGAPQGAPAGRWLRRP